MYFVQCRLIVAQMSNTRCEAIHWMTPFIVVSIIVSMYIPILERPLLYLLSILTTLAHWHYGTKVVSKFKINIFNVDFLLLSWLNFFLYLFDTMTLRSSSHLHLFYNFYCSFVNCRCSKCVIILTDFASEWRHRLMRLKGTASNPIKYCKLLLTV